MANSNSKSPASPTRIHPNRESPQSAYRSVAASDRPRQNTRMLVLSLMGIVVGIAGGLVAEGLLRAINFISNLCYYGKAILSENSAAECRALPLVDKPLFLAAGGLLVGILIRYCAPEIKGDGIPEAMSVAR